MDFQNRGGQPHSSASVAQTVAPGTVATNGRHKKERNGSLEKWTRIITVVLLFSVTVLFIAIAISLYSGNSNNELKLVNTSGFQAIDVNIAGTSATDQVYFGHIKTLNNNYIELEDVYYIPSSSSSSNLTLQPLVCQFDAPYNQVIVNRSNLTWWENLQSTSTVTKTITSYQKQNPNGPNCATTSSSSSTPSTTTNSSSTAK